MQIVLRLSVRTQPLAIWYAKALQDPNALAATLAKEAIRAHSCGGRLIIGHINLQDSYEAKQFRIKFNEGKDADIIEYLHNEAARKGTDEKTIVRGILLASVEVTEGPTKILSLGEAVTKSDYSTRFIDSPADRKQPGAGLPEPSGMAGGIKKDKNPAGKPEEESRAEPSADRQNNSNKWIAIGSK